MELSDITYHIERGKMGLLNRQVEKVWEGEGEIINCVVVFYTVGDGFVVGQCCLIPVPLD